MATFHYEIKSGKKGTALDHAAYITRAGRYRDRDAVIWSGYGNLPAWAQNEPSVYWRAADRYERANGAAYREHIIALPAELTLKQLKPLVMQYVYNLGSNKAYQFAIHAPRSSLAGEAQPHLHLMISDRIPDQFERPPERMFSRYNSSDPINGGRKKDSGGRSPLALRDELIERRKMVADVQNAALALHGHGGRVDHRSHQERGIKRLPERHFGAKRISQMSEDEKHSHLVQRNDRGAEQTAGLALLGSRIR